jgi:predicted SprT family Zn-dependent metalloprotease
VTPNERLRHKIGLGQLWEGLNRDLFHGVLRRKPRFHSFVSRVRAGYFTPGVKRDHIGVNEKHFTELSSTELVDTLAHEMIHQAQAESGLKVEHDAVFKLIARIVGVDASR